MKNISVGDVVKVVKSNRPSNWYALCIGETFEVVDVVSGSAWGEYVSVQRKGFNFHSIIFVEDVMLVGLSDNGDESVNINNETPSQLNVNGAVELLQGLLDYGYDPDVEIVLKHDSVRVNAFGSTFLTGSEDSLEDICKAITLLSGAKLGD